MSAVAGLPMEAGDVNRAAGQGIVQVVEAFKTITGLNAMYQDTGRGYGIASLTTLLGAPAANLIIASYGDLANLVAIAHAQQALAEPSDFFFNAKQLLGTTPLT
jgi:hypothetical protein